MSYFREIPDIEYPSFLNDKNSSLDYVRVKNLFRRVKLRDDLQNVFTLFNNYIVRDGARPDSVAEEIYGNPNYDWVVVMSAGIINLRNEWPLSNYELYNYVSNKYGTELNAVKHYVTKEVRDSNDRLILPAGKIVDGNFTIPDPANTRLNLAQSKVVTPVTNFSYETELNEEKRRLRILKPSYVETFVDDFKSIMKYTKSSEYVTRTLIRTSNPNIKSP